MTGTGRAMTSTPLSEQTPPTTLPAIVLGTMSPYLFNVKRNGIKNVIISLFKSVTVDEIQRWIAVRSRTAGAEIMSKIVMKCVTGPAGAAPESFLEGKIDQGTVFFFFLIYLYRMRKLT